MKGHSTQQTGLSIIHSINVSVVAAKIKLKEQERQHMLARGEDVTEITALIDNWMNAAAEMGQ